MPPRKTGEYLTDREADEAVGFIRKHKDTPFFLMLAHYAVHTPIQAKKDELQRIAQEIETEGEAPSLVDAPQPEEDFAAPDVVESKGPVYMTTEQPKRVADFVRGPSSWTVT